MEEIRKHLREHNFRQLFMERLGWDNFSGARLFSVGGRLFEVQHIAQKRGVQVLLCPLGRLEIRNRPLLRAVGRSVAKHAHEHVMVFFNHDENLQVWQWSTWVESKFNFRWREHPFRSDMPPAGFVARLGRLEFSLDEEDRISLADVLFRASRAFDVAGEIAIFFRSPRYAEESDRLAREMIAGGTAEFQRFVVFHQGFGRWYAHRYLKLGIDEEDLNQIAMIGLMWAARYYDPDQAAFTTYAAHWVRGACERMIPAHLLRVTMRAQLFWPYCRLQRKLQTEHAAGGEPAARLYLSRFLEEDADRDFAKHYRRIVRACTAESYDDLNSRLWEQVRNISDDNAAESEPLENQQLWQDVYRLLDSREKEIIRLRFNSEDGNDHTLWQVGQVLGLTRERIRQLEKGALAKLRKHLFGGPRSAARGRSSRKLRQTPPGRLNTNAPFNPAAEPSRVESSPFESETWQAQALQVNMPQGGQLIG